MGSAPVFLCVLSVLFVCIFITDFERARGARSNRRSVATKLCPNSSRPFSATARGRVIRAGPFPPQPGFVHRPSGGLRRRQSQIHELLTCVFSLISIGADDCICTYFHPAAVHVSFMVPCISNAVFVPTGLRPFDNFKRCSRSKHIGLTPYRM